MGVFVPEFTFQQDNPITRMQSTSISCQIENELNPLAIVESALRSDVDRPPWPEAGLDGGQLLAGGHPQVHRVVVPAAAAPCAEQARGG